jgi:hypothetical protein
MNYFKKIILITAILTVYGIIEFNMKLTPVIRFNIENHIYTIGDKSYSVSLKEQKNIIKFGSMFFGLYPGGLAFSSVKEAEEYMQKHKLSADKWGIYFLSGDYKLDTKNGFIINSMIVTKEAL